MSFRRYHLYHFYQLSQFPKYYDSFKEDLPVQCDQKKIAKCLKKLPKNDFTRKMKDFDNFTKIA